MPESVYFVHAAQPSSALAGIHEHLIEHIHKRGLAVIEYDPRTSGADQSGDEQWAGLAASRAVIAELSEADETVRPPLERALQIGKPVLALYNVYLTSSSKPAVNLSDLLVTRSQRYSRLFVARVRIDMFMEVNAGYRVPLSGSAD